jgi:ABC-type transport system substrate-binding protein
VPYSFYVIAYNTKNEPFSDIYFRKAINSATNKEELANVFFDDVTMNTNQYVNTSIFPSNSRYVKGSGANFIDSTPYNLSNTRSNLDRSANHSGSFSLLVSSIIDSENRVQNFVAAYSKQMEEAGINVTIDDASSPVYYQKIRDRSFDAVLIHLTGFDHFYDIRGLFRPGGERNIWGIDDGELNEELVKFGNTISWDELLGITSDIHTRVEELSPGCFIFTVPRRCYYSNNISDISIHPEVGFSTVENWKYKSK